MVTLRYAICLLAIFVLHVHGEDEQDDADADTYFIKFGYMKPSTKRTSPQMRAAARKIAIETFQEFANLPVTGVLDQQTKEKMTAPRCGMPDIRTKKNRASFRSTWDTDLIKWKLVKGTNQIPDDRVRKAIRDAAALWSQIIPMNFTEVSKDAQADMQFDFASLDHSDGFKFDGPGNTLAHAFYPKDGRLHFDDDEQWTFENADQIREGYTDLLSVTIHEMGHSLGLDHLKEEEAIMFPFYRHPELDANGKIQPFVFSQHDIKAIQEAYGTRADAAPEPTPPGGPSKGAACRPFQAVVTATDGATYFFDGNIGWKKADGGRGAANSGTRFYLDKRFPGGPTTVTAAVVDKGTQMTYLFQGRRVWAYRYRAGTKKFALSSDYPKDLTNDIPFTPTGGFHLNTGQLILFGGTEFVIWEPSSNTITYRTTIENYFRTLPLGTTFNYGDKVYFVDKNQYTVYDADARAVVSQGTLSQLITC